MLIHTSKMVNKTDESESYTWDVYYEDGQIVTKSEDLPKEITDECDIQANYKNSAGDPRMGWRERNYHKLSSRINRVFFVINNALEGDKDYFSESSELPDRYEKIELYKNLSPAVELINEEMRKILS